MANRSLHPLLHYLRRLRLLLLYLLNPLLLFQCHRLHQHQLYQRLLRRYQPRRQLFLNLQL